MTTNEHTQIWRRGAAELAAGICTGELSAREVVDAHLDRIAAVNGALNAVTLVLAEEAGAAADRADRAITDGNPLRPLHGVPFSVKENIDLAGSATTQGVPALASAIPSDDAPHVRRLRAAGAIPIARTNCPDFGIGWHTTSTLHGATRNPWNPRVTPGGSSGGEAAAIATGMSPLGVGGDLSGSLRWPASCCGVAALKPTLGRIPRAAMQEPAEQPISLQLMLTEGPLARRVADLRVALPVMSGQDWRDPWSVSVSEHLGAGVQRPRIALLPDPSPGGTSPEVQRVVRDIGTAMAEAEYVVEEIEPPGIEQAATVWLDILKSDMSLTVEEMQPPWGSEQGTFVERLFALAEPPSATRVLAAYVARARLQRAWGEFFDAGRVIVAPVYGARPFAAQDSLTDVAGTFARMSITTACNALGLPAVAVPGGLVDGLPIGVQVIGRRFSEEMCLDVAEVIESCAGVATPIDPRHV
ncbi:amidase [Mycetocola miduiensis]|uniref:Amidase n=1 Tax=Mycetocola miduiensis TaxID=995034 RepID=A0A1I4ZXQ9_9MICO|nr:amidase [Mycetocola miduiensis]SFN54987.1 amidase [Mycetocola miduiensis]